MYLGPQTMIGMFMRVCCRLLTHTVSIRFSAFAGMLALARLAQSQGNQTRGSGMWGDGGWRIWQGGWHTWVPLSMIAILTVLGIFTAFLIYFFTRPAPRTIVEQLGIPQPRDHEPVTAAHGNTSSQSEERDTFMVIPDISGYTKFISMNRFSAGHAQYVVSQLLDAIIEAAQPPLTATRVEGDAVVFYAVSVRNKSTEGTSGDEIGQAILDLVEAYYRRRAELIAGNGCPCDACNRIEGLDLKVVVHRGPIMHYLLKGLEDLGGFAVIATHRLLKNSLGKDRYVLVTQAAGEDIRLPLPLVQSGHRESYDGVGEIVCDVYEFEPDAQAMNRASGDGIRMTTKTRDIIAKLGKNAQALRRSARMSER